MTIFLISVLVVFAIVIYRQLSVKKQSNKLSEQRTERIKPLYDKFVSGATMTTEDVLPFAKNVLTRQVVFHFLSENNKTNLFPKEYYNIIQAAESSLANWLEFPTELDACPDEIEHIKRVTFDFDGKNNFVHYEVFKCRTNEPHWAAKDGWFLGVVGPYFDDSKPYDFAKGTFSRISSKQTKYRRTRKQNGCMKIFL